MKILAVICEHCKRPEREDKSNMQIVLSTCKTVVLDDGRWGYETLEDYVASIESCCEADTLERSPDAHNQKDVDKQVREQFSEIRPGGKFTMITFVE